MRISCDLAVRQMVVRWGFLVGIGMWIWMGVGEDVRFVNCIFGVFVVMCNVGESRNPSWFSG